MIIEADLNHLEELAPLFDSYRVFYKQDSDLEKGKAFLKSRIENNESIIYMFYKDGKAVGFTQLYPKYSSARLIKNWILNDLYVDENYRREGIAKQLINKAVSFANDQEAEFIQLETQNSNRNAQLLYHKMNFQIQDSDQEFILFKRFL